MFFNSFCCVQFIHISRGVRKVAVKNEVAIKKRSFFMQHSFFSSKRLQEIFKSIFENRSFFFLGCYALLFPVPIESIWVIPSLCVWTFACHLITCTTHPIYYNYIQRVARTLYFLAIFIFNFITINKNKTAIAPTETTLRLQKI